MFERNTKEPKTFIIAEAGVNHNGSVDIAKKMVEKAAQAGADAVKFQTFKAESLVCPDSPKADYQLRTTDSCETQFEMIKRLELDRTMHEDLIKHCKKNAITFLSSPFDPEGIDLLQELGLSIFKIPSGEITNLPYLRKIGSLGKQIILSTGMSTLDEIGAALNILTKAGAEKKNIAILHCNTEYPTPMSDVNLKAMTTIKTVFPGIPVGYSDHTQGIEVAIAATALGAKVIEKHFTLDRTMEGPDHKASLEPQELKRMIKAIRNIELALGNGIKKPSPSEEPNIAVARKSIVAAADIAKGEIFTGTNITTKRPGTGISPMLWDEIIGKKAFCSFQTDELIRQN